MKHNLSSRRNKTNPRRNRPKKTNKTRTQKNKKRRTVKNRSYKKKHINTRILVFNRNGGGLCSSIPIIRSTRINPEILDNIILSQTPPLPLPSPPPSPPPPPQMGVLQPLPSPQTPQRRRTISNIYPFQYSGSESSPARTNPYRIPDSALIPPSTNSDIQSQRYVNRIRTHSQGSSPPSFPDISISPPPPPYPELPEDVTHQYSTDEDNIKRLIGDIKAKENYEVWLEQARKENDSQYLHRRI